MKESISTKIKNLRIRDIVAISIWVFVVRVLFSFLPSFQVDVGTWFAWAQRLGSLGPAHFYSDSVWTQYTPGYLYYLLVANKIGLSGDLMIKIPTALFDIGTGLIVYTILKKVNLKFAIASLIIVVLNPVAIFNGSVWGQIDGILTFFLVLSAYFAIERKNIYASSFLWAIAFLIKPQAIAVLPFLSIFFLRNFKLKQIISAPVIACLTLVIFSLPFFPSTHIFGLLDLVHKMSDFYSYTSVFAFNFWAIVGVWKSDLITILNISYFNWGIIIYLTSMAIVFWKYWKSFNDKKTAYLMLALSCLAFFLFPTRVHERYIFPAFTFLLIAAFLNKSKALIFFYGFLIMLNFTNLYYSYAYYEKSFLASNTLQIFIEGVMKLLSFVSVVLFFATTFWSRFEKYFAQFHLSHFENLFIRGPEKTDNHLVVQTLKIKSLPEIKMSSKAIKILFLGVVIFASVTRFYNLNSPTNHYFDEVYHAFTAQNMLHGVTAAWEWWNPNPNGFAYEWTHPPLAKELMAVSMKFLGENAFGWRFPGALLGVGSVILIYFIAKEFFNDELVGLIAAGIFSLDGLPIVLSRIGMNDSYILFFSLAAVYSYLKNKNLPAAIFLGLALASKWSALWVVPIIFVAHFVLRRKWKLSYIFFFIIPPIIYISTYFPLFVNKQIQIEYVANTGYATRTDFKTGVIPLDMFIDTQKQMWWYHTRLKATHPYTSLWYTWPFMVRPIYLYTSDEVNNTVARIYAMGNPIVFWTGTVVVALCAYFAFKEKNKKLGLVVFSYLVFFTPWAISPRIMFLYHYLPSVPFMAMLIAYILRRFKDWIIPIFILSFVVFVYFYPHYAGLIIPLQLDTSYYWFRSWR